MYIFDASPEATPFGVTFWRKMTKKTAVVLTALCALALPTTASAQLGVAARAGSMGIGGEVSYGLTRMLGLRGGIGVLPVTISGTYGDLEYDVKPPETIWNVGVDVYPFGGGLRLSAGLINRPEWTMEGVYTGSTTVGGTTYTGTVDLNGTMTNERATAPYLALGFGRATGRGMGFFLDLGAAFMGEGDIELDGTCNACPASQQATFESELQAEEDQAQEDIGEYIKIHPIFQIGFRFGLPF
jgi:hypothetical protein